MHRHFEDAQEELKNRLLRMGSLCEEMIHLSLKVLFKRSEEPVGEITLREEEVNQLHIEIDDRCLKLIALHQPAAQDLRFIMAAAKINSDLERIGDQAVNISENACLLAQQPPLEKKLLDISRMAEMAKGMVKDSLDAFVRKDADLARQVIARDDEEDRLKTQSFGDLVKIMRGDSSTIERALDLILIARNLERIADHATNIAEDVIFMVLGKDIRHRGAAVAPRS